MKNKIFDNFIMTSKEYSKLIMPIQIIFFEIYFQNFVTPLALSLSNWTIIGSMRKKLCMLLNYGYYTTDSCAVHAHVVYFYLHGPYTFAYSYTLANRAFGKIYIGYHVVN